MGKKYRLMITSMYEDIRKGRMGYYYVKTGARNMYCDALLSAEASCKYILSKYKIDEIVVFGRRSTHDPGDELVRMVLRDAASFYTSDIRELSTYSLLRYRIAQYIDELRIDEQDLNDLLSAEEQERVISLLKASFKEYSSTCSNARFDRFFDVIARDRGLIEKIAGDVIGKLPSDRTDTDLYRMWIDNYLYSELRGSYKLELLEGNEDVKISFIPVGEGGPAAFADTLIKRSTEMEEKSGERIELELYVCLNSDNADDSFVLVNFMDIAKSVYGDHIHTGKFITCSHASDLHLYEITDNSELYGTGTLLAGLRSFLQYGKTDLLMQYWKQHRINNPYIERLMYAIRNIDIGISLCDTGDIERGISSLKSLFAEGYYEPGDSLPEKYFSFIIEAIKNDYSTFLDEDGIQFMDLVKWAYRKDFWQQTLTIIESRGPVDFVNKGIYYYCDSEKSKENALRILGTEYYNLKPFEKYKLEDIPHYFVKFYGRWRVSKTSVNDVHQRQYTKLRLQDLDNEDEEYIRAFTRCSDRDLLGGLLYAYYHLGDVRNATNHALSANDEIVVRMEDSDVSERMNMIKDAIENFIYMYDKVSENIAGSDAEVLTISDDEIRAYAASLRREFAKNRDKGGKH